LSTVARRAFLSLWSHSNVYTDEGRSNGKGDGKELCDLLVVFGDHVILFSDKHCEFKPHADIEVAWARWYRRAVEKSVRQLLGAEGFLKNHPGRLFLDKGCTQPLPLDLPSPERAKYHLVAATRGSHAAAVEHWHGHSSGSFILDNSIEGDAHHGHPFHIGWPAGRQRFIHVLDEMALDVVLDELDTVPDFIDYLEKKEVLLTTPGVVVSTSGEEDLVAQYLMTLRDGAHAFRNIPAAFDYVLFPEGEWTEYEKSPQRISKKVADSDSRRWDALIEMQSGFIRSGAALNPISGLPSEFVSPHYNDHERIVRTLADETRLSRRVLEKHLKHALSINERGRRFARIAESPWRPGRFYVFLTIPKPPEDTYDDYRAARFESLFTYCHGLKTRFPTATEVIGITSEPIPLEGSSQDFLFVDMGNEPLSREVSAALKEALDEAEILQDSTMKLTRRKTEPEFPFPFSQHGFDGSHAPLNRAQRRAQEAKNRSKKRRQ